MAMRVILLVALFAVYTNSTLLFQEPERCYPEFNPRPSCTGNGVRGWTYWKSMQYKYFPKRLSKHAAEKFCKPFDEEICKGEDRASNFRAHLGSFISSCEVKEALLAAYEDACIKEGELFWIGVNKKSNGKLVYTDYRSSNKNTFPSGDIPWLKENTDCVAMNAITGEMVVTPCSTKLPLVCKIQPVIH